MGLGMPAFKGEADEDQRPPELPLIAEAVEELFSGVRDATLIRQTVDRRKKESDCHHPRFHYCVADLSPRVREQRRLYPDSVTAPERRPLSSAKPTFESALRFQRVEFQTETLPIPLAFCMALAYDCGDRE